MERIAPLAKILAEANGIEWQQLNGTGAGGMIVEQDILDYLSRVMSGEAEPPSTPVDAPPPDWNGEDLPGVAMFDAQMLSQAGVESDIADFVQQSRPVSSAPGGTLSQDDFELDEAQDTQDVQDTQDAALLAPPAAPAAPSPFDIQPIAPAATSFSSGPIPTGPVPVSTGPVNRIPESPAAQRPESPVLGRPTLEGAAAPAAPAAPPAPAGGLGSLLSRLYHKGGDRSAAPVPPAAPPIVPVSPVIPASPVIPVVPAFPDTPEPRPSSFGTLSGGTGEGSFGAGGFGTGSSGAGGFGSESVTPPAPPFNVPPVELRGVAPTLAPLTAQAPTTAQAPITAQMDVDEVTPEQAAPSPLAMTRDQAPQDQAPQDQAQDTPDALSKAAVSEVAVPEATVPEATVHDAAVPNLGLTDMSATGAAVADVEPVEPVHEAAPVPVEQRPAAPRDAVWFGTYLRRDAGVAQLHDLRSQLSEALEREVPLALLVARAAQRHAAALGLGSVALRDMDRGLTRQVGGEVGGSVSLRDALQATDQDFDGAPDLLVVDAGALDMDDLHYPDTLTLSVGRVQEGRAALSLQGDVDPEKAARFLASVAQTLEKPIILLV